MRVVSSVEHDKCFGTYVIDNTLPVEVTVRSRGALSKAIPPPPYSMTTDVSYRPAYQS